MDKEINNDVKKNMAETKYRDFVEIEESIPWWKIWERRRYQISLLALFGFINIYTLRTNLSIAIVAMTENKSIILENGTTIYQQEFNWTSTQTGIALSSFFYGYITTQIIGGFIAEKYGGAKFFGLGIFITAVLTLLTPVVAKYSLNGLIALRVIEGIFEGMTYPALNSLWARWAPPLERSRLASSAYAGSYIGTVIAMTLGGFLAEIWGWESIFYFFGTLGVIWYLCWFFLIYETPSQDRFISDRELNYITSLIDKDSSGETVKHPWMKIVTSVPVWAIFVGHFCENWGFYTLLTELPTFMNNILNFDISSSGILSSLPYIAMSITTIFSGFLADFLRKRKILTTTQVRRIFCASSFVMQTIFLLTAGFVLNKVGSIVCIVIAVGSGGFALSGYLVNYLDIGPSHASIIMGIGNSIATIPGMISPTLTGILVPNGTPDEWRKVFYVAAGIYIFGAIIYGSFASGNLQEWSWDAQMIKQKQKQNQNQEITNKENDNESKNSKT